jgi:hypothetical protein
VPSRPKRRLAPSPELRDPADLAAPLDARTAVGTREGDRRARTTTARNVWSERQIGQGAGHRSCLSPWAVMWISSVRSMYSSSVGPRERGDGVAERDAAVESGPEVGGSGGRVYVIGQATGDDREKVVEGTTPSSSPTGPSRTGTGTGTSSRILVMKRTRKIPPRSRAKRK